MKKAVLLFIFFLACSSAMASPQKDEDFGIWSQNDIEARLGENWKIRAGEELRFREHQGIYYYDTHIGASYKVSSYLTAGADYLQARQTRSQGKKDIWYWEERPRVYLTPQIKVKGFLLENRNMLEFRFKHDIDNTLRYRNQVSLTAPWKWTRFEIQPFVSSEAFFETSRNGLVEDRLIGGVRYHLWRELYGSLFYMRQFTKNSAAKWKELNTLGIGVKVSL